ncbi:hypothetical protein FA743_17245 [Paracoccus gahaiensis]|uniref:Uncharacterized protein n=1 Tax=Paracoccus gahaiensis TaxID=1706839 RepID=A0A4V5MUY2_9RHOB|nr:hypothetical protein [Paracoccus gahaiensis]TJZ89948.1 hypothetical protein FA743_17245 [Paracoccus gahaiensis]
MRLTMAITQKGSLTTEPQKLTTLFWKIQKNGGKRCQAETSGQMAKTNLDEDIERMIEAKVALALRVIKL